MSEAIDFTPRTLQFDLYIYLYRIGIVDRPTREQGAQDALNIRACSALTLTGGDIEDRTVEAYGRVDVERQKCYGRVSPKPNRPVFNSRVTAIGIIRSVEGSTRVTQSSCLIRPKNHREATL